MCLHGGASVRPCGRLLACGRCVHSVAPTLGTNFGTQNPVAAAVRKALPPRITPRASARGLARRVDAAVPALLHQGGSCRRAIGSISAAASLRPLGSISSAASVLQDCSSLPTAVMFTAPCIMIAMFVARALVDVVTASVCVYIGLGRSIRSPPEAQRP